MSSRTLLLFLITTLFSNGCNKPSAEPDPEPLKDYIIGSDGGSLESGDFVVDIPIGAFSQQHKISIGLVENDGSFGENAISHSLKIKGLPSDYEKPIEIMYKYNGENPEGLHMAVGIMSKDVSEGDSSLVYQLTAAENTQGYLSSKLPAFSPPSQSLSRKNSNNNPSPEVWLRFLESIATQRTEHFTIYYPLRAGLHVLKVEEIVENAYSLVDEELDQPVFENDLLKRNIVILNQGKSLSSQEFRDENGLLHFFNISLESLNNFHYNEILIRAAQELYYFTGALDFSYRYWAVPAIYYWIEDLISDAPGYTYPKDMPLYGMHVLSGLEYSPEEFGYELPLGDLETDEREGVKSQGNHGKGRTPFIKYLSLLDEVGLKKLNKFSGPAGLLSLMNNSPAEWWPDFLISYLGNLLFEMPEHYFRDRAHGNWEVNEENDTLKLFSSSEIGEYQDLSAKIFRITLNYSGLEETHDLSLDITRRTNNNDYSLLLFSTEDGAASLLSFSDNRSLLLENLKNLQDKHGKDFLAVVANNSHISDKLLGKSEIDLQIQINKAGGSGGQGDTGSFTDPRDNNSYQTIKLGNQWWMAENLKYLPAISPSSTESLNQPVYYVYDYEGNNRDEARSSANFETYGVLYNWPAAREACPAGWHLPTDEEWKILEKFLGMSTEDADAAGLERGSNEGSKLSGNSGLWEAGNLTRDYEFGITGFEALPGGFRGKDGGFDRLGEVGLWWSSSQWESSENYAWRRGLLYDYTIVHRSYSTKEDGFSVRCVKD